MNKSALTAVLAPVSVGLILLGGCTTMESGGYGVSDGPVESWYPHDHVYGYRNRDGLIVDYDPEFMLYAVVSSPSVYWNDGYYYRRHEHNWERSRYHHGPWSAYRHEPPRVVGRPERRILRPMPLRPDLSERRPDERWATHHSKGDPVWRPPEKNDPHRFVRRPQEGSHDSERTLEQSRQRNEGERLPEDMPRARDRGRQQSGGGSTGQMQSRPQSGGEHHQSKRGVRLQPTGADQIPHRQRPVLAQRHQERVEQARKYPGVPRDAVQISASSAGDGGGPTRQRTSATRADAESDRQGPTRMGENRGADPSRRRSPWRQGEPRSGDQRFPSAPPRDAKNRLSPLQIARPPASRELF